MSVGITRRIGFTEEQLREMASLYQRGWGCARIARRFGCLSGSIHRRLREMGVPTRKVSPRRTAKLSSHGYVMWGGSYVHRIVAEGWMDRPLAPGENVHHKDGDKTNNHPDNLQVFTSMKDHLHAERWRFRWDEARDRTMLGMREAGYTAQEIADALGTTKGAVDNHARDLRRAGHPAPRKRRKA